MYDNDIMLSHSPADTRKVRRLAKLLAQEGLRVWLPEWNIMPGDDIFLETERAAERSQVLALVMTANTFGPDWAWIESGTSLFRNPVHTDRRFIPILLRETEVPAGIRRLQCLDLTDDDDEAYEQVVSTCRRTVLAARGAQQTGDASNEDWLDPDGGEDGPGTGSLREIPGIAYLDEHDEVVFTIESPKGKSSNDSAVRLALVAAWAHLQLRNQVWISGPKVVVPLLRKFGCYDGNTRKALAANRGIIRRGQQLSLTTSARAEAERVAAQIVNPDWRPDAKTTNEPG